MYIWCIGFWKGKNKEKVEVNLLDRIQDHELTYYLNSCSNLCAEVLEDNFSFLQRYRKN
jgi:hypothetical protein